MVTATAVHPWKLVGPWYRWSAGDGAVYAGVPEYGRAARPVFQKYADSDFVNAFLADPQHSLRFDDGVPGGSPGEDVGAESGLRKLFLPTHHRFYLVVCELHCDQLGFPRVNRDEVCEAGFVVRRRHTRIETAAAATQVDGWLKSLGAKRRELARVQRREESAATRLERLAARGTISDPDSFFSPAVKQEYAAHKADLEGEIETLVAQLAAAEAKGDVVIEIQGWFGGAHKGYGDWIGVDEDAGDRSEEIFPLYPLVPAPSDPSSPGHHGTIWFGAVPTGSADLDSDGSARFDDRHVYQVECFVRRHRHPCPRKRIRNDCHGELVWSDPTEPYRLAGHFDVDGTNHKPVMVQLPDLADLKDRAALGGGVGMIAPPASTLDYAMPEGDVVPDAGNASGPGGKGVEICFFAIPLITIVAMFLLKIVLPIVVFLFNLWFLLKLKFCIPPSLEIGGGVSADLDVEMAKIELAAELDVSVDLGIDVDVIMDAFESPSIQAQIRPDLLAGMKADLPLDRDDLTREQLERITSFLVDQSTDFSGSIPDDLKNGFAKPPDPNSYPKAALASDAAGLAFYEKEEWPW